MLPSIEKLSNEPQKFSRSPLGIIALFIILIYSIASLVLGRSFDILSWWERLIFESFLFLFPLVVIFTFYKLVTEHHMKLYAPWEFPDIKGFIEVYKLTLEEQQKRFSKEVSISQAGSELPKGRTKEAFLQEFKAKYFIAEELALRYFEDQKKITLERQVSILGGHFTCDGFYRNLKGGAVAVEVKYITNLAWKKLIDEFHKRLQKVSGRIKFASISFILIIVTDVLTNPEKTKIINEIEIYLASIPFQIELQIIDFKELNDKYSL